MRPFSSNAIATGSTTSGSEATNSILKPGSVRIVACSSRGDNGPDWGRPKENEPQRHRGHREKNHRDSQYAFLRFIFICLLCALPLCPLCLCGSFTLAICELRLAESPHFL